MAPLGEGAIANMLSQASAPKSRGSFSNCRWPEVFLVRWLDEFPTGGTVLVHVKCPNVIEGGAVPVVAVSDPEDFAVGG